jgi:hypothetical protein
LRGANQSLAGIFPSACGSATGTAISCVTSGRGLLPV